MRGWIALVILLLPALALAQEPRYGDPFWSHWGDGRAELAAYDLVFSRYGEERRGTAVAISVTETFSNSLGVKADPGRHPESDTFPVFKLNLVEDFPTGVYDYNLMTSAFLAITPVNGLPAGSTTKVSFSSQEWCGHVYQQMRLGGTGVEVVSHSYFDGEADQSLTLPGEGGLSEDALWFWARGFASPVVEPGASVEAPILRSAKVSRLRHRNLEWEEAKLRVDAATRQLEVPAGTFEVRGHHVEIGGAMARAWTFWVETSGARRVVKWESSLGQSAELLGSERMPYWQANGPEGQAALTRLGLKPRAARMP